MIMRYLRIKCFLILINQAEIIMICLDEKPTAVCCRFFVMATRENLPQGNNPQKRKKNMCKLDK